MSDQRPLVRGGYSDEPAGGSRGDWKRAPSIGRKVWSALTLLVGCALLIAGCVGIALYQFPYLQLVHRYAVMVAAFIPYGVLTFAGSALLLGASPRGWARVLAAVAVAGLVLQVWSTRPYWPRTPGGGGDLTVLTMNMRCNAPGMDELALLIDEVQPDVAVVVGLDWEKANQAGQAWGRLLPHRAFRPMPNYPICGSAVLSRTPLREVTSVVDEPPIVEVLGADRPLYVIPVDVPTPTEGVRPWARAFRRMTESVSGLGEVPIVVAGDFNATREHVPLRTLMEKTGLQDAREVAGAGWVPTFPADKRYPALLGLDHVLISEGMSASGVRTHKIKGQGHLAVSVRISDPRVP